MPTCAETLATTLRDAGVERMFGLPGGEVLPFVEAARKAGIQFILARHEAVASLMADVTGQMSGKPGVCVSTLGPGAMNLALGVANAYLDRSPMIAITATTAEAARPYTTHQQLDLNAIFRPFTKDTIMLDGVDTAATVRRAWRTALSPRRGPVHLALPSDVSTREERQTQDPRRVPLDPDPLPSPSRAAVDRAAGVIARARRPIAILGLDLDPHTTPAIVRRFVETLGIPVFVTPKAKGIFPEDHPLFLGVCGGLAADAVVLDFLESGDLLVGIGFEPVESDKTWHQAMPLVSISPVSIAAGAFAPVDEVTGDVAQTVSALMETPLGPFEWTVADFRAFGDRLERTLDNHPSPAHGLSPLAVTRCLRELYPPQTVLATDVGSIKLLVSQAWTSTVPLTFLESNGLSSMGYALPAAMAAAFLEPDRPVLCTMGDGGYSMVFADLETAVRHRLAFVTVVYNDSALSLIQVAQERRGYADYGVSYGEVDFAAASAALGAWSRRVRTMPELRAAVIDARAHDGPAVVEVLIDPTEYRVHAGVVRRAGETA
jgi:acetolactate synthase-1/2/3 large subunit